ncbi:Flp family type IVb pilin [Bacillus sp. JJ1532]|uniref:Flp family type IVb pilin n=1 Tax=unclassified Bacillus (in: firmicutes) TaxID=185979 RepID=UPI002FFF2B3F
MLNQIKRLFKEEEGQALTEYGLLVGLVAIAVIATLGLFKDSIISVFTKIKSELNKI